MRILVDMDGVLADFESGFLQKWQEQHHDKTFIPLEERNTFYLADQYPQEFREFVHQIYGAPGFFRNIQPIFGGREALHEMEKLGIEVFICTSPLRNYQNCVLEKYQWVEKYLGADWTSKVIMVRDKTLVRGDILIDDRPNVEGADVPTWEHVLYDQPYNRSDNSKRRLTWDNWKKILLPK